MDRLVCGDVGFGKTEIAIRAAFRAACDGKQVAVLVPTTILSMQHFKSFSRRLRDFPVTIDYINRFKTGKALTETLMKVESGETNILVGTHALVGKRVKFKELGLLVIDEEQKFGVRVKDKLKTLKANVDALTLTATPIPRTLTLTAYGDLDHSLLTEKPPGRQPIETVAVTTDRLGELEERIGAHMQKGGRAYWVCPLVEETEEAPSDLTAAEARFAQLKARFGQTVSTVKAVGNIAGLRCLPGQTSARAGGCF